MRKELFVLLFFMAEVAAFAQTEATQYFMTSLPQVSISNPAFMPVYKFSIGLPALSSVAATYSNNGFSYNDLTKRSSGTTTADLSQWNKALTNKNYISTGTQIDLFRLGLRVHPGVYLQFSATAKQYSRLLIPRDLTTLAVQGTVPAAGTTANFSPGAEGMAYLESAMAAAIKVNRKLTIGMRLKYIKGIMDATTIASNMNVTTGSNYAITAAADLRLRTSGVFDASQPGYSFGKQFGHYMSNNGAGIDVGATYNLTDKITVAASVVDLGKIYWKNDVYDYVLNKATANYTFSGIDADKLVQGNTQYLGAQGDSISKRFAFQKQKGGSYSTWLPAKMYVSSTYALATNLKAGLLVFAESFRGRFSQGASVSMNKNVGKWLSTTVSYTVSNRSYNNVGAGISFNFAPIQFYVAGDNLLNAPVSLITSQNLNNYLNNTKVFTLRAGINIVWGRSKDSDKPGRRKSRSGKSPEYINLRKKSGN